MTEGSNNLERSSDEDTAERYRQERRSQLRGLLLLALAVLGFLLWRAQPLLLFRSGWWRP